MTMRLHVTALIAALAVWPAPGAWANGADPLKIPGAEPKPAHESSAEAKPAPEGKVEHEGKPAPAGESKPARDGKAAAVPEAKPAHEAKAESRPAAEEKAAVKSAPAAAPALAAAPAAPAVAPLSDAQKYCQNVAAAAADARFAWQSKRLAEVEAQIKQRVAELDARQAEVKDILTRYSDAVKRAKAGLVDIYAKMKPETAALQIAGMEDGPAAAILSQLNAQKASAILNEIPPERAVKLVTTMSALVPPADGKKS